MNMRVGLVVNTMDSTEAGASTYRLATDLISRGHEAWVMSTGNFAYDPDDAVRALARTVPMGIYKTSARFLAALKSSKALQEWITVDDLDVLLLRSNPSVQNAWAQAAGIHFGRMAMHRGVIVLNDPNGLSKAMNKLYFQTFPEEVRPRSLITRNAARLKSFAAEQGTTVIKPLSGSGARTCSSSGRKIAPT